MKWKADSESLKPRYYEIRQDSPVDFVVFAYENGKVIYDYLQDDLDMAMRCARDEFGVPMDAWKKVEEQTK